MKSYSKPLMANETWKKNHLIPNAVAADDLAPKHPNPTSRSYKLVIMLFYKLYAVI